MIFKHVRNLPNIRSFSTDLVQKACVGLIKNDEQLHLCNRVALITGAANGIGFELARCFLCKGVAAVTIADVDKCKGIDALKKLTMQFGEDRVMFMECDVAQSAQFDWALSKTVENFERIDILVNNAGIMDDQNWQVQLSTNIGGTIIGSLLGFQYMSKSCAGKGGTIINVASVMSLIPSAGFPLHTMTQHAILGLCRSLGVHYERTGVKVFGVFPGLTNTTLLENAFDKTLNEHFAKEFREEIAGCCYQSPRTVADGVTAIVDRAKPGSIWFMENNGRPHEIQIPEVVEMVKENLTCRKN